MTIPHAADVIIRRMSVAENLGRLFEFQLDLTSNVGGLSYQDFLGQSVTVNWELPRGGTRHFNGILVSFGQTAVEGTWHHYHAVLRPWFWLLTRSSDCRIFQNVSVIDIFKSVCSDLGFTDYKLQTSGTYAAREYCVQYRETAFDFLSRLFECEGIYYYFTHEDGKHYLVLSDGVDSHQPYTGYESIAYEPKPLREECISSWNVSFELQPGTVVLNDFSFLTPKADLKSKLSVTRSHPYSTFEIYDYPGGYFTKDLGDNYVRARIEERQSQYQVIRGSCDVQGLAAGSLFTLTDHPRIDQNDEYLIVSTVHQFVNSDVVSECSHQCDFVAIPKTQTFRSPRITPRPVISGPQTAIVTGASGDEIWTDSNGRVKVQFHWDRVGTNDENSSCWIRVAQTWAGNKWGSQFLPRVGHEVVVEFMEGDPDRPLIVGSVYNADQPVPYSLPDNATQSGIKSHSSKEGDDSTFNELRFEDSKGKEQIYFHAEKDFQRVVENNDTLTVGLEKKDPGDQTIQIHNNRTVTIDEGNDALQIKKGNRDVKIDTGNDTVTVSQGSQEVKIAAGNHTLTISQGNQTISISVGSSTMEAAQGIELKVGGNSIKIDPAGITVKGTMISIEGQAKLDLKAPMTTVNGDGMLTLKGGLTQIN
jgi:type VI secretion system secreted protein VgrG